MRVASLSFVACVLLQACVTPEPVPTPPRDPAPADLSSCHAVGLDGLVGSPVTQLPKDGAWSRLRVIPLGMMVTMDYSATRLNVQVDGQDIILSLYCG